MGVQIPPKIARAGRYARSVASVAFLLCILYVAITNMFTSWDGFVIWLSYLVWLGWWLRRQFKAILRKKTFDAHLNVDQMSVILHMRRIVEDAEAHTIPKVTWKFYFTRRYWRPMELPPMPSLEGIEMAFKDSEDAVGPYDVNIQDAINRLLLVSRTQHDMDLERKMVERYLRFLEHTKGSSHETLIQALARAGQLHFTEKNYEKSAEELARALALHRQRQHRDPSSRGLLSPYTFMFSRKMLAMAYTMAKNADAAEALCVELLAELEQEEGMLSTEPLSTQMVRSMLIGVHVRQGWKAVRNSDGGTPSSNVARYLRNAMSLVAVHPSFYAHNLKQIGRLFIWAGRISDGTTAFRISNAVYESGKQGGMPQRNCLCSKSPGEVEEHGLRSCNACSKQIELGDRWFFCRACVNVDLCAGCHAGLGRGEQCEWEGFEKFPSECIAHEFYQVSEDELEEWVSAEVWIAEMIRRLDAEMKYGGQGDGASV